MLPSDMNLNTRSGTVGYNNKILVSDEKFSLGKNEKVNSLEARSAPQAETPAAQTADSNEVLAHAPTIAHKNQEPAWTAGWGPRASGAPLGPQTITHNEEKIALVLFLASG